MYDFLLGDTSIKSIYLGDTDFSKIQVTATPGDREHRSRNTKGLKGCNKTCPSPSRGPGLGRADEIWLHNVTIATSEKHQLRTNHFRNQITLRNARAVPSPGPPPPGGADICYTLYFTYIC